MIVDAHAHVWKKDPAWPDPAATIMSPASDVPLELLKRYMDEHGVGRTVLVQPMYPGEDNGLVVEAARAEPERFAAVVWVDPRAPERLDRWPCRGLRLRPAFAKETAFFENEPIWRKAAELGLVVSVLARAEHVAAIGRMAARFPSVPIIVDHLAHPDPSAPAPVLELARHANVRVKPTGYYYYSKQGYPYDDCAGLFRSVYDRFGPERMIWGSDFPHVLLKSGYGASLRLFPTLTTAERALVLGGNAERLYWPATSLP